MEEVGSYKVEEEEEEGMLPGFRFHPTDEELVGFYLRRKVEKKPLRIELIKHVDIYKYDPWDLPKEARSSTVGEKEWYFFCIRGRKYRNSIRPNRVTGSGFWKATGIDKPIHSLKEPHHCIGLKKSLVYYRGTAGKGTKTDWMMHEFRLPPNPNSNNNNNLQEAEVWTLCRIFKRIPSYKKYTPTMKDTAATASTATKPNYYPTDSTNSKTCTLESDKTNNSSRPSLTTFRSSDSVIHHQQNIIHVERKPVLDEKSHFFLGQLAHHHQQTPPSTSTLTNYGQQNEEDVFANGNWDELRSVVQFAVDPSTVYDCTGLDA